MKLIIAEKNSVAQSIAKVLGATERKDGYYIGNQYMVSWCVGHLVELADASAYDEQYAKWRFEDLPIIPPIFRYRVSNGKEKQFNILKKLMEDSRVTSLVCATDAGREGELIFRFVYEQAGCTKPFERLWISSMEDTAIKEGFDHLKDGSDYDNLYASALCRAKADWLIGINQTRQFSVLYGPPTLNVGRVQTPTLAMLVERDAQIGGFQKEKFYHAHIFCGGFEAASERTNARTDADQVQAACHKQGAAVASVKREEKTVNPPKLYDLTTLQREANRLYGYTANQTLEYTQSLYEKKLVTYPRTDSQFLTEDMRQTALGIAADLLNILPFAHGLSFTPDVSRVINNAKVSDHHAIIPTAQLAGTDLNTIPETERAVLLLIGARLLCATADKHTFEAVTAVLDCNGYSFTAKGKTVLQNGWKELEQRFKASIKNKEKEDEPEQDKALPPLSEGDSFDSVDASVTEHTTSPPKPYTEDTLLAAMETAGNEDLDKNLDTEKKGLGTPATRASIIEKLVTSGFAERKKKQLLPTKKGADLITVLPEEVKSPKMTAEWENALTRIAAGSQSPEEFMQGIEKLTSLLVRNYSVPLPEMAGLFREQKETIGPCPRCTNPVAEGKKNFYCTNKACKFSMWKDDRFFTGKKKTLTKKMAADLLSTGKTPVKGLYSEKKDSTYDAVVVLADTGDKYVNYKLEFAKK